MFRKLVEKLCTTFKLKGIIYKILDKYIPQFLTKIMGTPMLADKFTVIKSSFGKHCHKVKAFKDSLKTARNTFKERTHSLLDGGIKHKSDKLEKSENPEEPKEQPLQDGENIVVEPEESSSVTSAVKHIVMGVGGGLLGNKQSEKLLKIKHKKSTSLTDEINIISDEEDK